MRVACLDIPFTFHEFPKFVALGTRVPCGVAKSSVDFALKLPHIPQILLLHDGSTYLKSVST